jgi:hypothetical protein
MALAMTLDMIALFLFCFLKPKQEHLRFRNILKFKYGKEGKEAKCPEKGAVA